MRSGSQDETEINGFAVRRSDPHGAVPTGVNRVKGRVRHGICAGSKNWISYIVESRGNQVLHTAGDIPGAIHSYAADKGRCAPDSRRCLRFPVGAVMKKKYG